MSESLGLLDWLDERYVTANRAVLDPLWQWRRRVYGAPFLTYLVVALIGSVVALLLVAHVPATTSVAAVAVAGRLPLRPPRPHRHFRLGAVSCRRLIPGCPEASRGQP
ncbi:hypothetical protein IC607_04370 [Cellulomonas sp. JH27-2]|uniref:hypothetical protein n=1 Tax=Cellulomonas sp. JH27-2 TaxID=2774139 RepID=UPI00178274F3|nr:hypothetical protein [Cellulomonas sp. JH27-2]MBD8058203.1 hypothetical protein [Cellulomonas sp. JH27-2]